MLSGPICAMVWEGRDACKVGRSTDLSTSSQAFGLSLTPELVILGTTNPLASAPGTIRGDYAIDVGRNVCHGSDGVESAKKEIDLWFKKEEIMSYEQNQKPWIYELFSSAHKKTWHSEEWTVAAASNPETGD
jgi:nucleoside-diphosphate kinase